MKEPEHGQAERDVKGKDAEQSVTEGPMVFKGNEVLKIGGEASDDQGRHDERRATKRVGCGCMRDGKRHYENYDGFGGSESHGLSLCCLSGENVAACKNRHPSHPTRR